jgi:transposase
MSDSFIHELPLETPLFLISILNVRLNAGRVLYNGILCECLKRLRLLRESKEWQRARSLPQGKERSALFKKSIEKHRFREYDIHHFLTEFLKSFPLREHLDSQVCQKIATRAFLAAKEYSLGKRGRPRYKSYGQFCSVEGKSNLTGLRFKEGMLLWGKLRLKPLFNHKDPLEAHALHCKVKYVRLVRRRGKGKDYFYMQLVLAGKPLCKEKSCEGVVGIDLGPSTIALFSEKEAFLNGITQRKALALKSMQRKISRSFQEQRKTTSRCKKLKQKVAELQRKATAERKCQIGTLVNKVLSLGNTIHLEKLSYKSFQKNYGRSVQSHAPGQFVKRLSCKAENAGGRVIEINTYCTKLSQTCHGCGKQEKKPLNQRWHACSCGISMQRDLYSAFLAFHVKDNILDRGQAFQAWPGAEPLLKQALSRGPQAAKHRHRCAPHGDRAARL